LQKANVELEEKLRLSRDELATVEKENISQSYALFTFINRPRSSVACLSLVRREKLEEEAKKLDTVRKLGAKFRQQANALEVQITVLKNQVETSSDQVTSLSADKASLQVRLQAASFICVSSDLSFIKRCFQARLKSYEDEKQNTVPRTALFC